MTIRSAFRAIDAPTAGVKVRDNRTKNVTRLFKIHFAIMTAPEARDPGLVAKLDAVAGRVLGG